MNRAQRRMAIQRFSEYRWMHQKLPLPQGIEADLFHARNEWNMLSNWRNETTYELFDLFWDNIS